MKTFFLQFQQDQPSADNGLSESPMIATAQKKRPTFVAMLKANAQIKATKKKPGDIPVLPSR